MKYQIKSIYGDILFEYEIEDNNLKKTLVKAVSSGANLRDADLYYANLYCADLRGADLRGANLYYADLCGANLYYADLCGADLRGADLRGANLYYADLRGANLCGANLEGANLYYADLEDAKNAELAIAKTRILPEGDLIGYKKCRDGIIVKLLIPKEAKRSSAFGRKCRAEYADVLDIIGSDVAWSRHDSSFTYKVGQRVTPKEPFSEDWTEECASGIHFFITKLEAENH